MHRILLLITVLFSLSVAACSQPVTSTAPVNWQFYKISERKTSILLPKMPVFYAGNDPCQDKQTLNYAVYAEGVVYGLTVASKMDNSRKNDCPQKQPFSEKSFTERVTEIKDRYKANEEGLAKHGENQFLKLKSVNSDFWLLNDFENKRWFELWISGGNADATAVKNFLASLNLKNLQGIEIGNGSPVTLGDEKKADSEILKSPVAGENSPIKVALKGRANYTDSARRRQTEGTCKLNVTFLANGSIGTISVVEEVPNGLTEEAVAAARKIVFVPAVKEGVFYTVTKAVHYNFTLY